MKLKYEIELEVDDDNVLDLVNEFQENHAFETFDSVEDIPNQLFILALEFFDVELDPLFNEEFDSYKITIL